MNIHRFVILGFLTISICLYISLDSSASYDRIQIVITSSSDWTILTLNGNERIANAKSIPLQGSPECHWNQNSLSVNQPLEDALQGQSVQAQFNIILSSESPSSLSFESTKGSLGNVRIDFYNHNNNTPQMVDSVENTNTSGHPNPKLFSIDAEALLEGDFAYARPGIQPLILAFYYPWYKLDAWQSPYLQDKPLIPYSSDNMSTIYHHVCLAKQSGIDGFISSWWGPGSDTDQNLQKLLTVSENMDFKVSIYFETLTDSGPRTEAEILSWLRYFLQTYGEDLRFFQSSGKPVIFIWAAGTVPVNVWGNIFNTLESEGLDAIFIADTLNQDYLQVFDGLHTYGPTGTDPAYLETSEEIRTYGWLENNPQLKLWAATTQPGYDDRSLPGRVGLLLIRSMHQ